MDDYSNLENELSKINLKIYQELKFDKDNQKITVSNPWYGKILNVLGFKTKINKNISNLIKIYLYKTSLEQEKVNPNYVFSNFFNKTKTINNIIKLISNDFILKSEDIIYKQELIKDLQKINKKIIRKKFLKGEIPSLNELLEAIHLDGKEITPEEKSMMSLYQTRLTGINKSKLGYELIERNTRSLNLKNFTAINVKMMNSNIQCYDLSDTSYQFIVHAASVDSTKNLLEIINKKPPNSPSLCTSLINENTSFFDENLSIGLVLAVDPKNIILTSKRDILTPSFNPSRPNADKEKMTRDFYNFYEKMSVFIGYIDHLYHRHHEFNSGNKKNENILNDYQQYSRLSVLKEELNFQESKNPNWNAQDGELLNEISETLDNLILKYPSDYFKQDFPQFQLNQLIDYYKKNSNLSNSPDEFKKIFGREGNGVLEELNNCLKIITELKANDKVVDENSKEEYLYRLNFNRIMGPHELLSQTYSKNSEDTQGMTTYNEINVRLDDKQDRNTRPLKAEALIINKEVFTDAAYLNKMKGIIKYAEKHKLPIFLR